MSDEKKPVPKPKKPEKKEPEKEPVNPVPPEQPKEQNPIISGRVVNTPHQTEHLGMRTFFWTGKENKWDINIQKKKN